MSWRSAISRNLSELRLVVCQSSAQSSGARAFITNNYAELAMLNPQFPIRVRPAEGISPALIARYDWGATEEVSVAGMSEEQIEAALEGLVNAGASMKRSAETLFLS
eukprot:g585.t1